MHSRARQERPSPGTGTPSMGQEESIWIVRSGSEMSCGVEWLELHLLLGGHSDPRFPHWQNEDIRVKGNRAQKGLWRVRGTGLHTDRVLPR